jgi:hypothetical protein
VTDEIDIDDRRSSRLRELAVSLAYEGREDPEAVQRLREEAGMDGERFLAHAADVLAIGPGAPIDEFDEWELAYRLLRAATVDGPVQPVTPERAKVFDEVRALEEASPEAGWIRLVEAQPALRNLETKVRQAAETPPNEKWERHNALEDLLDGPLGEMVGPRALDVMDPLLRTNTAFRVADKYLGSLYGVAPEERYIDAGGGVILKAGRIRKSSFQHRQQ